MKDVLAISRTTAIVLLVVLVVGVAAGSILAVQIQGGQRTGVAPTNRDGLPDKLVGGGSTFINPLMQRWTYEFRVQRGLFIVDYQSIGSGQGIAKLKDQAVDFAASDGPLKRRDWEELRSVRGGVIHIPIAIGAVVAAFNIPGIDELRLDEETLLGIFNGSIGRWDDPRLVRLNQGLENVDEEIIVVYRADRSGTTFVWTDYLGMLSGDHFPTDFSFKVPDDPAARKRFIGAKGNEGVTEAIKQIPYSIGYIELSYAILNNLTHAMLENAAGSFVKADRGSISSAVSSAVRGGSFPAPTGDWSKVSLLRLRPKAEDAYPVISFVYALVYVDNPPGKARALKEFFSWVLEDGQQYALEVVGYVPLPEEAVNLSLKAISVILPNDRPEV